MERGFQMGGRGGIIDVSYLKPSRTKRILETFPQRGEPRGSSSVQRGAAGEEGRRESRNIGGEGCALSAGWKTMEFDEACQLTISMVVDRVNLGQRDYFFRKEERRACSTDSFQFERKPSSNNPAARMWRGLDDSRRATKLIHDIFVLLRKIEEHAFDDSNSNRAVPSSTVQEGEGGKQRNGITTTPPISLDKPSKTDTAKEQDSLEFE